MSKKPSSAPTSLTRRRALVAGTAAAALLPITSQFPKGRFMSHAHAAAPADTAPRWMTLLGVSEQGGRSYAPTIEGTLPAQLSGTLYRNGPGLFERNGYRKQHMLDGDGLAQRLTIRDGKAHYSNAFIDTPKLRAEEEAGKYLHATWTTRRPGGFVSNIMGGDIVSQAGVTVYPVNGKVVARDEGGDTFVLDPDTLATTGTIPTARISGGYKAHAKHDPQTNEWILAGQGFGPTMTLHVSVYSPQMTLANEFSFDAPRQVYIHDFFASKNHIIFVLHPCFFSPFGFLAGMNSITDSLTFNQAEGTILAVVPKAGGEARYFDVPGSFMWHALNAHEAGDEIVADFVGYDDPDHFIGDDPQLKALMVGRLGKAVQPGTIRRYVISLATGKAREEILDAGTHEFPMTDPRAQLGDHKVGYFSTGGLGAVNSGIKRMEMKKGRTQTFDFGANTTHVGEPVFAARDESADTVDDGWLIAQCLDAKTERTFFAVFDASAVDAGPLAKIWLTHHVPISFHGGWAA
ncbi:carotenoid oxygenase family protein [Pyruvatibacter sp.]|uniref:carotenoid oxygenase family protein n=1 Tax=Pyruvatibacter sp. TaxID=1981328 RepID=UPI0032EBBEBD